jgi:hypothetical protein
LRAEQRQSAYLALRSEIAACRFQLALMRLGDALRRKYRPDQPRVPAGQPGGGQWTDGDGRISPALLDPATSTPGADNRLVVAGGFTESQMNMTVRQFASKYCLGRINRELPTQLERLTISELQALSDSRDDAAVKCLKLLKQDRFRK